MNTINLNASKLASLFVTAGYDEDVAITKAVELYENESKVMFRAILWGVAKFGKDASYDPAFIQHVIDTSENNINEFQAQAKIAHAKLKPEYA